MQYKEWLDDWLELYVKPSAKERTYRKYRQQAEKYILPSLGSRNVDELTPVELQRFFAEVAGRGLAPDSVCFVVTLLKASLKKGVVTGAFDRQYGDAIVRPKSRMCRVRCFTKAEQKKIEAYVLGGKPYLFGILLCLYTGLRIGELLALTWEDVDLCAGTIVVSKSCHDSWAHSRYVKVFDTTKTPGSERFIPLPKKIVGYLRELKKTTHARFVVVGRSEYGAEIRSYQRTFAVMLRHLGIEHRGFHALRHTFATRALEVGMDVKTLSEILGHRDPSITLRRYAHSLLEHKTEMMNKVGKLL